MNKILLAIDNKEIFESIKKENKYNFFDKDIVYKEGIIEVLEKNFNISLLILNNDICGNISFEEFIIKIKNIRKNIKIVIFINKKDEEKISFLNSNGIYQIYRLEELKIKNIKEIIENIFHENIKINKEINNLKKLLNINTEKNFNTKIIIFIGENNVGKTLFSTTVAQIVESLHKKTLLVSLDYIKKDISILINNDINMVDQKIKITNFLDLIYIEKNINILKKEENEKYDYIIIDTSSKYEFIKYAFINNIKIIFIVEPTLLGVNKANLLLEKFYNEYKIDISELEIIFNKFDKNSISKYILKEIFKKYNIIGFCKNGKIKKFINKNLIKERSKK